MLDDPSLLTRSDVGAQTQEVLSEYLGAHDARCVVRLEGANEKFKSHVLQHVLMPR